MATSLAKPDCYARSNSLDNVERFVLSSLGSRVGDKCEQTKRSTAVVRTVIVSVNIDIKV